MNKCFLYEMLRTASPSGQEFDLQKKVINYMRNQCHEVRTDLTGNVISVLNPESPVRVLLAGHIDEIALMVTMVTSDGLLKVTNVGGVRPALYLGQKVRILTEKGMIKGIVGVNKELLKNKEISCTDLFIDLGVNTKEEALALVELGNLVIIDTDFEELSHSRIAGRAMDNRVGAFIVIEALRRARELGA
ncbi:MAG TPA: peptidase M20, partial [Firmicutes bacterium]|nr:peptidase M20 [Bacillota bacterium]